MAHQHAARSKGFHKKGAKVFSIPGTKPSIQNHTLLVSSGIPSLDALIGLTFQMVLFHIYIN